MIPKILRLGKNRLVDFSLRDDKMDKISHRLRLKEDPEPYHRHSLEVTVVEAEVKGRFNLV